MAIETGDAIEKFGGQAAITNPGIVISSGALSTQANAIPWTNIDDATDADFVLEATFQAAPDPNSSVSIIARKLDVRSTNDENLPSLDNEHHTIGVFQLDSGGVAQVKTSRARLPSGRAAQGYEFYLKNDGGQNITSAQAWITPIAVGPHP